MLGYRKRGKWKERTLYFIILCAFWDKPKLNLFCLGTYDSFLWPKKRKDVPKVVDTKCYKHFGGRGLQQFTLSRGATLADHKFTVYT